MAEQSNPTELIDNIEQNDNKTCNISTSHSLMKKMKRKNTGENNTNVETLISDSISDPGNGDNIDNKIRDLIIERTI